MKVEVTDAELAKIQQTVRRGLSRREKIHLGRERIAMEQVGAGAERRLRWLVEFAEKDLERLHREERTALGYTLRAAATPPIGVGVWRKPKPLTDAELAKIQQTVSCGLRAVVDQDEREALKNPRAGWQLPVQAQARLVRLSPRGAREALFRHVAQGADETDAIILGVANLVERAGRRLRGCRECRKPFLAPRRQALYCGKKCSDRYRNRKKIARRREMKTTR